jgi:hypothetical protein
MYFFKRTPASPPCFLGIILNEKYSYSRAYAAGLR